MRVEMPSGNWVEIREALKAADKFAVQDAVQFLVGGDAAQMVSAGLQNTMRNAFLARVIEKWSYPNPVPSAHTSGASVDLGELMDLDDYNVLQEAVEPLFEKVGFSPNTPTPSG